MLTLASAAMIVKGVSLISGIGLSLFVGWLLQR